MVLPVFHVGAGPPQISCGQAIHIGNTPLREWSRTTQDSINKDVHHDPLRQKACGSSTIMLPASCNTLTLGVQPYCVFWFFVLERTYLATRLFLPSHCGFVLGTECSRSESLQLEQRSVKETNLRSVENPQDAFHEEKSVRGDIKMLHNHPFHYSITNWPLIDSLLLGLTYEQSKYSTRRHQRGGSNRGSVVVMF